MHDQKNVKKQAKSSFQTPPLFLNSYNSTSFNLTNLTNYDSPRSYPYYLTPYNSSEVKN